MEKPRIGVFVCNCGTNISHIVDTEAVRAHAQAQPDVVVATSYRYM